MKVNTNGFQEEPPYVLVSFLFVTASLVKQRTFTFFQLLSHPSSGQPAYFQKELENQNAIEGDSITLRCELSKPVKSIEWRKGGVVLQPSKKFEMKKEGCVLELHIHDLEPEDNGYYTCDAGNQLTTASVTVQGIK